MIIKDIVKDIFKVNFDKKLKFFQVSKMISKPNLANYSTSFSYSKIVKEICDSVIFARGQKLFWDNLVLNSNKLILENWLEFEILDKKHIYYPRVPLLHLLLPFEKWDKSGTAFEEFASCNCDYFASFGVCAHLVAASCWLDSHFELNEKKLEKLTNLVNFEKNHKTTSLLDQIMAAEIDKIQTIWLNNWQYYLIHPINFYNSSWHKKAVWLREVGNKPEFGKNFAKRIKLDLPSIYKDYHKEKNLVNLAFETVLAGGIFWWNFWQTEINFWTTNHQILFYTSIWQNRTQTEIKLIWTIICTHLKSLTKSDKDQIFASIRARDTKKINNLQSNQSSFKNLLELATVLELEWWFLENLESFDVQTLLKIIIILDSENEKINFLIAKKILDWSNFIQSSDNYEEFAQVLENWQLVCPENIWQETISEIINLHHKKTKLMALISKFTPIKKLKTKLKIRHFEK